MRYGSMAKREYCAIQATKLHKNKQKLIFPNNCQTVHFYLSVIIPVNLIYLLIIFTFFFFSLSFSFVLFPFSFYSSKCLNLHIFYRFNTSVIHKVYYVYFKCSCIYVFLCLPILPFLYLFPK